MSYQSVIIKAILEGFEYDDIQIINKDCPMSDHEVYRYLSLYLKDVLPHSTELEMIDELSCLNKVVDHWKSLALSRGIEASRLEESRTNIFVKFKERDDEIDNLMSRLSYLYSYIDKYIKEEDGGFVYLMKRENSDTKIGVSKNPLTRLEQIRKDHTSVELVYTMKADKSYKAEKILHDEFAEKRKDGEWFSLSDADIKSIKNRHSFVNNDFLIPMSTHTNEVVE